MERLNDLTRREYYASFPFADEKATMEAVNAALQAILGVPVSPDKTGIYLISSNAGFYSSVAFWEEVLEKGPGLANPERFPWTLANAPCGAISRAFGITGPNYTFHGTAMDLPVTLEQIDFDLSQELISQAWLIALDFGKNLKENTRLSVLVFSDALEVNALMAQLYRQPYGLEGLSSDALKKFQFFATD